jgi:hypothetical protein
MRATICNMGHVSGLSQRAFSEAADLLIAPLIYTRPHLNQHPLFLYVYDRFPANEPIRIDAHTEEKLITLPVCDNV